MLFDTWYLIILRNIPEGLIIIAFCLALVNRKDSPGFILKGGLILVICSITYFFLPFNEESKHIIHIPLHILLIIVVLKFWFKLSLFISMINTFVCFVFITTIEYLTVLLFALTLDIPYTDFAKLPEEVIFYVSLFPLAITLAALLIMRHISFDGRVLLRYPWKLLHRR